MMIAVTVSIGYVAHAVLAKGGGSERVSAVTVDLWHDTTAEGERGEGVVVGEQDYSVDELCQGPAVLLSLKEALKLKKIKIMKGC